MVSPVRKQCLSSVANDQRLLTLVGCIGGIGLEFDEHLRYVNAWADDPALLALPPQTMIGRTIIEVLGEVAGASFTTIIQRVYATGEVDRLEYPIDLESGRRWFIADIKRVGTIESGMTVVLFARDITDRKATEEALRRSEERFRLAARATSEVLWDWDLVSGSLACSAAITSVLGYVEWGTDDTWWKQRVHPEDFQRVCSLIETTLVGTDSAWSDTFRLRHADGTYREVLDRAFIVRDADGHAVRMVGSLSDITPINRLRRRLLQSDRLAALGLLAAGVGHEINNPLTYVIGNIDAAIAFGGSDELRTTLVDARDGARRIAEIVKTLKLFSRAEDTNLVPVDLHAVLESAIRMAENEIRHRARLVRNFGEIPLVHSAESQVAQVCLNLLINAAQAIVDGSSEDHQIRISTSVDGSGRVAVSFEDTGTGISPEHLSRVFDPFFTTKDVGTGTGLGLTICHDIIEKLGGTLSISSELGVGTKVTVLLPAVHSVSVSLSRVLVIDDEAPIGRMIKRSFRDCADVTALTSSREALARIETGEHFDLILCDLMMPELTGIEVHAALAQTRPEILPRLHFMTGGAFTPHAQRFLASIGTACIEKPLDLEQLRALLVSTQPPASP